MSDVIIVKAAYDAEAGVWYVESSDIHGLRLEAAALERLVERLPGAIADLLDDDPVRDRPIEVIAHASTRLGLAA
jgi:hypothetical protein